MRRGRNHGEERDEDKVASRSGVTAMTDTLCDAYRQADERRRAGESTEWSIITVEPAKAAGTRVGMLGIAILDGRCRSEIHTGQPTVFRVEAGEHMVTARIKRRFWENGYPRPATASLQVVAQPGERVDLVFGFAQEWTTPESTRIPSSILLLMASVLVAFGIGWHAQPLLRTAVALANQTMGVQQPWSSMLDLFVSGRHRAAAFTMFAWVILAQPWLWRPVQYRPRKVECSLVLRRRSDFEAEPNRIVKQYVDPFE